MEQMFKDWLAANGIELEAIIFRSPRDWCADQYIFRFKVGDDDWSGPHILPWGIDTLVNAQEIIGKAKP